MAHSKEHVNILCELICMFSMYTRSHAHTHTWGPDSNVSVKSSLKVYSKGTSEVYLNE